MDFENAAALKKGDIIRDCFGNKLVVYSVEYNIKFDTRKKHCYIQAIDTKMINRWFSNEDVYSDNIEKSDQEIAFLEWVSQNKDYVLDNYDYLHIMRQGFFGGFSYGYDFLKEGVLANG